MLCLLLAACGTAFASGLVHPFAPRVTRTCVDPGPTLSDLHSYERTVHRRVGCVVLFDNRASTWAQWDDPWPITERNPDANWTAFARAGHRIVLTVDMFPSSLNSANWRAAGAAGAYAGYARRLAGHLVAAGMGSAIIRLGHEANGTWYADNVGTTPAQEAQWKRFWARTVRAMRSVPGAHFSFDWCVSAGVRPIPLADYYPGDDVVDSVGIDVYDSGVPGGVRDRWRYLYDRAGGVGAIVRFARRHHKPLAIPEWGLQPTSVSGGAGSDPSFTRGIVRLIHRQDVSFEAYFFQQGGQSALLADRTSMRIYRRQLLR